MKTRNLQRLLLSAAAACVLGAPLGAQVLDARLGKLAFRENRGQWPAGIAFQAHAGPATAWFHEAGVVLDLAQHEVLPPEGDEGGGLRGLPITREVGRATLRLSLVNARFVTPRGEQVQPGVRHYFHGSDPSGWARDVRSHAQLVYSQVYAGIDAVFRTEGGQLAYDFHVAPWASMRTIEMRWEGARSIAIERDGSLRLETALGAVRHSAPRSFERRGEDEWAPVASRFELRGGDRVGFAVDRVDPQAELRIDPVIDWSSFMGGANEDFAYEVVPVAGTVIAVVGTSKSSSLPRPWSSNPSSGNSDAMVALVDTAGSGTVIWSALIGGSGRDLGYDIAWDATSQALSLVGITASANFPLMNPYPQSSPGTWDGWVALFDLRGNLMYSSCIGTSGGERFTAVQSRNGILTIGGFTNSLQFPMVGCSYQSTLGGGYDAVLLKLDPQAQGTSQILASTYLGGPTSAALFNPNTHVYNWDILDVHVAPDDSVWMITRANGNGFPTTTNAYQCCFTPGSLNGDVVFAHLDAGLCNLLYGTYVGSDNDDSCWTFHVDDATGIVTFATLCFGQQFPVTPSTAPFPTFQGGTYDMAVARLDTTLPPAQQLLFGTYIGGSDLEHPFGLSVEPSSGILDIVGGSKSPNLPTTPGARQPTFTPDHMGVALRLEIGTTPARAIHYMSYVGPPSNATGPTQSVFTSGFLRPDGRVVAVGQSTAANFPTTPGAPQGTHASPGTGDGILMCLDLLPIGADRIGAGSPACAPQSYLQVNSAPAAGNAAFELLGENLPAAAPLLLAFGPPDALGTPLLGATLHVQLTPLLFLAGSDPRGLARLALPIPAGALLPAGWAMQLLYPNPGSCGGAILGASDAIAF